jgi:uncharacterized phage-associated protein
MLITHDREKTINAILFFAHKVNFLGKTKLFKLLYFLDFEHYRDTGRSVTGMDYFAWKMGPVPISLMEELDAPEADLCEKLSISEIPVGRGGTMLKLAPLDAFDPTHFTLREMRSMERLATNFRDARADEMVDATHLENSPWDKVYHGEGGHQARIPYEYILRAQDKAAMLSLVEERRAVIRYLGEMRP